LAGEPIKKCRFAPEGFGRAARNSNTTLEIAGYWSLVRVLRSCLGADMGESNLHREENTSKHWLESAIIMLPSLSKSETWVQFPDYLKANV
jgi:hypothetical protein